MKHRAAALAFAAIGWIALPAAQGGEIASIGLALGLPSPGGCKCPNAMKARSLEARKLLSLAQDKDARRRRGILSSK